MYKRELKNLINSNKLPKSILLYGVCEYQVNLYGKKISSCWSESKDDINTFYFDAYDFSTVKNFLSQSSLFGDKNVAIIKTEKVIPKKELDALVDICQKTENSHLLLQCYKDDKKITAMTRSFGKKKSADFVRFFKPNMGEAMSMLNFEARQKGVNIQGYALNQLYIAQQENLALAVNELDKLLILNKEVAQKDIDRYVYGLGEVTLESLISDIFEKKDIKSNLKSLLEEGSYTHIDIVNSLQKYIVQLYTFNLYVKSYGALDIKAILGYNLPRDLANIRSSQCMRLDLTTYRRLFEVLALCEYELKTKTGIDKDGYLFSLLLKIQMLLR